MKIKRSSYFTIVIMLIMVGVIVLSIQMEHAASKVLPLILGSGILVLGAISLVSDSLKQEKLAPAPTSLEDSVKDEDADEGGSQMGAAARARGYLINGGWLIAFVAGIYVVSFYIAIFVFMLAFMKTHRTRWAGALITSVVTTGLVYVVFERLLQLEMYRGIIYQTIAG